MCRIIGFLVTQRFGVAIGFALGPVKKLAGFVLPIPEGVEISEYSSIVIWCESFGEFIIAAKYN